MFTETTTNQPLVALTKLLLVTFTHWREVLCLFINLLFTSVWRKLLRLILFVVVVARSKHLKDIILMLVYVKALIIFHCSGHLISKSS